MRELTIEVLLLLGVGYFLWYKGTDIFNSISEWSLNNIPQSETVQGVFDWFYGATEQYSGVPVSGRFETIAQLESVIAAAKSYNQDLASIPTSIVIGMIRVESSGNPNARGSSGEYGLMQIMPPTWTYVTSKFGYSSTPQYAYDVFEGATSNMVLNSPDFNNPFEPVANVIVGMSYLKVMFDNLQDWDAAIQAYNVGLGGYRNGIRNEYVAKVRANEPYYG